MNHPALRFNAVNTDDERAICAGIMSGSDPWITLGITTGQLLTTLNDPLNEVYAARAGDEIVGTMVIQMKGAFSGYLKSIAVRSDWRGRGAGKALMDFVEKRVFATCANLFLCVSSFNTDALRFYTGLGYEKVGVLKDYLVRGHDEILMRKSVAPILETRNT